jgi:hypothetical protein
MDLITGTDNGGDFLSSSRTVSTMHVSVKRDVPPTIELEPEFSVGMEDKHWNALLTAAHSSASQHPSRTVVTAAHEMDLVEAASKRNLYDKILLLVKHGEEESQLVVGGVSGCSNSDSKATCCTNCEVSLSSRIS